MAIVYNIFSVFSITAEVFLRRKFGERYFSGLLFSFSTLMIYIYATTSSFVLFIKPSSPKMQNTQIMVIAAFAYLGFSAWHQFSTYRRNKRGEIWHSRCSGISWGIWKKIFRCSDDTVQMYIEPIFCGLLCVPALTYSPALHLWLFVAAVGMFVKGRLQYIQSRKRFLDALDSQIESECINAALVEKKSASELSGLTVVGVGSQPLKLRKKIADHFQGLDEGLKNIMGDEKK